MARPRVNGDRVTTAVRLPEALHRRLQESAVERDLSVNLLVTRAIEDFLERLRPVEDFIPRGR